MAAKLARSQRTLARNPSGHGGHGGRRSMLQVGDLLAGKYRVERIIGEGGMGVVVAAHHELLDQHVAVKLLYQDVADREAQSRLLLEARACARLQSDHVARVVDVDTGADGLPFIVMELLEGADLCALADARGALPHWLVVDYILQALEGLAHAHVRGIVHRDLKPSNLFLTNRPDGSQIIKILDFGISKTNDPADDSPERRRLMQLTGGRTVLGSPPYMSPEQVRSPKTVDHRTDIWSLGICLYELLTNAMPFGGDELQETFAEILEKQPQPIRQLAYGVPEGLELVVMRCLAKKREARFADVRELARALVPFGTGAWTASPERVAQTFARGFEDVSGATRVPRGTLGAAIPSSPNRRVDSHQPELHGTANTVALGFGVFETKNLWLIAAPALLGIVIAGAAIYRARTVAAKAAAAAVLAPPALAPPSVQPSGAVLELGPTTSSGTPGMSAVGGDGAANGASEIVSELDDLPTPVGGALANSSSAPTASPPTSPAAPKRSIATTVKAAAPASANKKAPTVPSGKPSLPPGLPRERQ